MGESTFSASNVSSQPAGRDGLFQCSICHRLFPSDQVYTHGIITCKACFSQAQNGNGSPGAKSDGAQPPVQPSLKAPHSSGSTRLTLLPKITCPHCWRRFRPEELLWVSRHADLLGDQVLGSDAPLRFRPSRFTIEGHALDARGMACQTFACPHCHLVVPRPLIEAEPLFASIIGVPSSGKSYFLTAMTWELRRLLPAHFAVGFNDADPASNRTLNQYEETLFLQGDQERPVKLEKTDIGGLLLYDEIHLGQQVISLPHPFLFALRPSGRHPNAEAAGELSRVLCLYDNAGEHFSPGEDTTTSPVTQHLSKSRVLIFLYDPTQDPRFRAKCRGMSRDPQLEDGSPTRRQETILLETAARVRQYTSLPNTKKHDKPLLVVVPKADVWGPLIGLDISHEPIIPGAIAGGVLAGVDLDRVDNVSAQVRTLLLESAPEFVTAAEDFCSHVIYIPVSALGCSPEIQEGKEGLWVRSGKICPQWVSVPVLYMFARWSRDVIGGVRASAPRTNRAPG